MGNEDKKGDRSEIPLLPANGDCRYELGYEIGLDFERLRLLDEHNGKAEGRKSVKKC